MNNIFIHYPKCTTCQRAKKFLDDNNINAVKIVNRIVVI